MREFGFTNPVLIDEEVEPGKGGCFKGNQKG
jgi:hypothetical protein